MQHRGCLDPPRASGVRLYLLTRCCRYRRGAVSVPSPKTAAHTNAPARTVPPPAQPPAAGGRPAPMSRAPPPVPPPATPPALPTARAQASPAQSVSTRWMPTAHVQTPVRAQAPAARPPAPPQRPFVQPSNGVPPGSSNEGVAGPSVPPTSVRLPPQLPVPPPATGDDWQAHRPQTSQPQPQPAVHTGPLQHLSKQT